jgi:hypothetical protein
MPKEINNIANNADFEGMDISMEKMRERPDFRKNQQIWEEIKIGIFDKISKLTLLTPDIAEDLSYEGYVCLDGLMHISDKCAEKFRNHKGNLFLNGLVALSDKSAEYLSGQKGFLHLAGLTSLSDQAAESLANHRGEISTNEKIKQQIMKFRK